MKRYRKTPLTQLVERYDVYRASEGAHLEGAKKLHAAVYLRHGFVEKDDITADGYIIDKTDPHAYHSDYFVAVDNQTNEVVALIRQIHQRFGHQLPVIEHKLTQQKYVHTHKDDIVELSAFAKKQGVDSRVTLLLFGEMLRYSKQEGHHYWVFACDSIVYRSLKTLFGGLLKKTGPETFYMGSKVIPAEVNLDGVLRQLYRNYRYSVPPLRQVRRFLYDSIQSLAQQSTQKRARISQAIFWNHYAKAYDGLLHLEPYRHLVDHVSDLGLQSHPKQVLDLGCGTGNVTIAMLKKNSMVHIEAVDWSEAMLARLTRKTTDNRLTIRHRDAVEYLSATRRRYDVIILNNVVYTIADRELFWSLIAKRLNKGGRVVIAHPDTANSGSLLQDHIQARSAHSLLKPRLIMIGMFDAVISFLGMSRHYVFTSKDDLLKEIEPSGLQLDGEVGRCYGGHTKGIDLLFTLKTPDEV